MILTDFTKIPISKVTKIPDKSGTYDLLIDSWWACTEDDCILLYGPSLARQCNTNRDIIDHFVKNHMHPATWAVHLDVVFLPHNCEDYR